MTAEKRRALLETVRERAHQVGLAIDDDPRFLELVDLWIEGQITSLEMRERYMDLLSKRSGTKSDHAVRAKLPS